mmetsp:Transcript_102223/g.284744  ORF Transcript_102223/g.284744 Transcript_102223/m.284744 type:complete len:217 (+) Transcript_102223:188-838(+)
MRRRPLQCAVNHLRLRGCGLLTSQPNVGLQHLLPEEQAVLLAAVVHPHRPPGLATLGTACLYGVKDLHAADDLAKDHVAAVEPWAGSKRDEELGIVCVPLACVRHGQHSALGMLVAELFVAEALGIDRLTHIAITVVEVAALAHKARNDPVHARILVPTRPQPIAQACLAGAEAAKVFRSNWQNVVEKLELEPPHGPATDGNVQEDARVGANHHGS